MISVLTDRRPTPAWMTDYLRTIGGTNVWGEPNFILYWGETRKFPGITSRIFYDVEKPCWILAMWHAAYDPDPFYDSGPPELWDYSLLGPYPHRGAYHTVQEFRKDGPKGAILPNPAELTPRILTPIVSIVWAHRLDSHKKRLKVLEDERERKAKELEQNIADRLQDAYPSFQDAVSFSGQTNCNSVVQQKMEQIEKNYAHVLRYARQRPGKLSIGA